MLVFGVCSCYVCFSLAYCFGLFYFIAGLLSSVGLLSRVWQCCVFGIAVWAHMGGAFIPVCVMVLILGLFGW